MKISSGDRPDLVERFLDPIDSSLKSEFDVQLAQNSNKPILHANCDWKLFDMSWSNVSSGHFVDSSSRFGQKRSHPLDSLPLLDMPLHLMQSHAKRNQASGSPGDTSEPWTRKSSSGSFHDLVHHMPHCFEESVKIQSDFGKSFFPEPSNLSKLLWKSHQIPVYDGPVHRNVRLMHGGTTTGLGGGEASGGGSGISPMIGIDEDSIKQEEDLFSNLTVGGGASGAAQILSQQHQLGSSTGMQAMSTSPGGRLDQGSQMGGSGGTSSVLRCHASSSPGGRYSPSSTAMQSELDYGECPEDLHSPSPHLKIQYVTPQPPGGHNTPSPSSPDRHYCSSTTSLAGDSTTTNVEEEDAPRKMCLVCGDVASGFHYGVASCEACKAFFKRTIQGNIEYNCPASRECEINKKRRKACQACRFSKCLAVGMLKEGVRLDRVRGGRQKYRRSSENNFNTSTVVGTRRLDELKLLVSLRSCEPESTAAISDCSNPTDLTEMSLVGTLADFYDRELVATIGWAKLVPGFTEIILDDQMRLLQSTWGEILTLGLAYRSMSTGGNRLHFAPDLIMDENSARELQALELHTHVLSIVERLESLSLHHDEYLILKALVLTNSDVRLQDMSALLPLKEQILQTLTQVVENIRTQDVHKHLSSLLLILPALRSADSALRRYWLTVKQHQNVPMNKLFLEMLDSPYR